MENDVEMVARKEARSGKVSYGDPVVIHESSKSRVVFVPFFIPHSDRTGLATKVTTYAKMAPPHDWVVREEKSLSLDEAASRRLFTELKKHLAVSEQSEDGDYLVIRIDNGTADLGGLDPEAVALALTRVLAQDEIVTHLSSVDLGDEMTSALQGAIRLNCVWQDFSA